MNFSNGKKFHQCSTVDTVPNSASQGPCSKMPNYTKIQINLDKTMCNTISKDFFSCADLSELYRGFCKGNAVIIQLPNISSAFLHFSILLFVPTNVWFLSFRFMFYLLPPRKLSAYIPTSPFFLPAPYGAALNPSLLYILMHAILLVRQFDQWRQC